MAHWKTVAVGKDLLKCPLFELLLMKHPQVFPERKSKHGIDNAASRKVGLPVRKIDQRRSAQHEVHVGNVQYIEHFNDVHYYFLGKELMLSKKSFSSK